jgi:hypothetical protein
MHENVVPENSRRGRRRNLRRAPEQKQVREVIEKDTVAGLGFDQQAGFSHRVTCGIRH